MKTSFLFLLLLVLIVIAAVYYYVFGKPTPVLVEEIKIETPTQIHTGSKEFVCQNNKSILANFYQLSVEPEVPVGEEAKPNGTVKLTLSDGRSFDLAKTSSVDGGRYASLNDIFVFWEKGNGVLITENNIEKDFIGCVKVAPDNSGMSLPAVYVDTAAQFSVRLPNLASSSENGYVASSDYIAKTASGTRAGGVKFTIPTAIASGTNLATNSYISFEKLAVPECNAIAFGDDLGTTTTLSIVDGTQYYIATTSDAGAGNRYEETVFALPGTSPCLAIRYFVHYTVLENYATGTVQAFDKKSLLDTFDQIRQSLVVNL